MIKSKLITMLLLFVCLINSSSVFAKDPAVEGKTAQSKQSKAQAGQDKKQKKTPPKPTKANLEKQLLAAPEKIPVLLKQGKLSLNKIPNPHWKENGCTACHRSASKANSKNLRNRKINKLCNTCHEQLSEHDYIHVSDIEVPKAIKKRMPKSFLASLKRGNGKMTCITCHDLPMTCYKKRQKERAVNPKFFREGPYRSRSAICYKCHDASKYKRVNAHDQINEKGQLNKDKCPICHTSNQDMTTANLLSDVEYNLKDNLSRLCWGCHPWRPHPGGSLNFFSGRLPNHLVKPSAGILNRMKEMEKERDIIFPLEPGTGKVFCATCHNPHEKGVIKVPAAAKGADERKRLRRQDICDNCHDK